MPDRTWGWRSDLPTFAGTPPRVIRLQLSEFVCDASPEQVDAWDKSIPWLQHESGELVRSHDDAKTFTAILEYELPRESRRPDVIVLENGVVVVLELKGKEAATQADMDQVAAYARDLRCYHAECASRPVRAVLVPSRRLAPPYEQDGVTIAGRHSVHQVLLEIVNGEKASPLSPEAFLDPESYRPLPTLVQAARDLFAKKDLPYIKRARAATDPAVDRITAIAHEAARTQTRRLVLVTGVPGSGKTLVGIRLVHAGFLDDLSVERKKGKPTAPAIFLSGNQSLVEVLQYALREAGGDGKVFVRGVKDYVKQYSRRSSPVPPEHLLVFDEAQRAWDAERLHAKHDDLAADPGHVLSEPELFVRFAERIPGWCVVVGLIGTGQEIHIGEEGGLAQWKKALDGAGESSRWTVHAPAVLEEVFQGGSFHTEWNPALNLNTELRFHEASDLAAFVESVLESRDAAGAARYAAALWKAGMRLLVTRSLDKAKSYLRERYGEAPLARYGLLASAKDKDLVRFGVMNDFQSTKRLRVGPWYNAPASKSESCCSLETVATEFSSQGLELDMGLLAWGTDFLMKGGAWSIDKARGTRGHVRDPFRLRLNVYRVLLTRGRDGTIVFVPPDSCLDETFRFLLDSGFREIE